jgi:hypothetical protein
MSTRFTRYRNRNRPAPVQGAVVVRGENAAYCRLSQRIVMAARCDTVHRSQYIISQIGLIAISNGKVIIQIPIVRRLI